MERSLRGVTDADGTYRREGLLPGEVTVSIFHPGYDTARVVVDLSAGKRTSVEARLEVDPLELATIRVRTQRTRTRQFREFYERVERRGSGRFITRDDIEAMNPRRFNDLLRRIPNLTIDCSRWQHCTLSTRANPLYGKTHDCPIQFYVNGVYFNDVSTLDPDHVEGVEIYSRGRGAPGRYRMRKDSECGVILVWVRHRR